MPTSPSLEDEVAFISNVKANKTLALYSFDAWNNDQPATYTGGYTLGMKWGGTTAGTAGGTVRYYFDPASHWTAVEKQWLTAGLALWSAVTNISFAATTIATQAQISFTRGSDGGASTDPNYTGGADAGLTGGTVLFRMTTAAISIDTSTNGFGPISSFSSSGGYPILTLLHEEGHAIGLGHAGPYNDTVDEATQQFSAYDTTLWSIMSYIDPATRSSKYFSQYTVKHTQWAAESVPTTWMPLDILAAQRLYGMPTSTPLSGGQIFGFHCNVTGAIEPFFDFTKNTTPVITIWDKGQNNTLDLSGFSVGSSVNLNSGTFSSCDGLINNIAIAFNTAVNTLDCGPGNDIVTCNNGGDTVVCGAGADTINGGAGNDILNGGAGNDTIKPGAGNDTASVGDGNDTINMGAYLTAADKIDGGAGSDAVQLSGNYSGAAAVTFNATTMVNVEVLQLMAGHSYALTTNNATVASGQTLTINGSTLGASDVLTFNGAAETNGHFIIIGGLGADILTGGALSDTFTYTSAAQSTSTHYDTITGFKFGVDSFDIPGGAGVITGINTKVTSGALSITTFDTNLASAISSSHLGAHHAVLFTPNSGTLSGQTFLIVDLNGVAGYQTGSDLVIRMNGSSGTLAAGGFH